ncbi:hypothetical protein RY831_25735 [Noviherbaspirillum sp. CPCC 100848]|uniref:Uncharacterized protein n=1 Tax=Noviherbaspirillum album TaxID=3080276 RepID=A0ABU6JFY7_9BURK|nr:hypothetical protein [Noviherbaspirillum sp. CPCC 100848]MEC4722573.1 hypothetical protein [Noviherbaspirillum sp. CPCC 100848]
MPDSLSPTMNAPLLPGELAARALRPAVVYAKTARGHEEVSMRTYGLTPKQRRVLIMMNGKKDLAAIAGFVPQQELTEAVPFLLAEKFISEKTEMSGNAMKEDDDAFAGVAEKSGERTEDRAALAPIKQMMTAAATQHLGLLASDIVRRIENAGDRAALQSAAGYWHIAILESKTGGDKAGFYLAEVRRAMAAL